MTPSIDLFASRLNHKVDIYCAWNLDPLATYIDAFSLNWKIFDCVYIFCPFSLLSRCIRKIQNDQAQAVVISANLDESAVVPDVDTDVDRQSPYFYHT